MKSLMMNAWTIVLVLIAMSKMSRLIVKKKTKYRFWSRFRNDLRWILKHPRQRKLNQDLVPNIPILSINLQDCYLKCSKQRAIEFHIFYGIKRNPNYGECSV